MKLILLAITLVTLTSCEQFRSFIIANEATIETAVAAGARIGAQAGIAKLKRDAKQPRNVTP